MFEQPEQLLLFPDMWDFSPEELEEIRQERRLQWEKEFKTQTTDLYCDFPWRDDKE